MLPHQAVAAQVSPHDQVWAGDMAQAPAPGIIGLDAGRSAPAGSCRVPRRAAGAPAGLNDYDYYPRLTSPQQAYYRALDQLAARTVADFQAGGVIELDEKVSLEDEQIAFYTYWFDHPEQYWIFSKVDMLHAVSIDGQTSVTSEEDVAKAKWVLGIGGTCDYKTQEAFDADKAKFEQAADDFLKNINLDQPQALVALDIYDRLIKQTSYDTQAIDKSSASYDLQDTAHTAYGPLVDHQAVCDGYSQAYATLLERAGIHALTLPGSIGGGGHAWNIVQLPDGQWYECDATWDDDGSYSKHDYINLTTDGMRTSYADAGKYTGGSGSGSATGGSWEDYLREVFGASPFAAGSGSDEHLRSLSGSPAIAAVAAKAPVCTADHFQIDYLLSDRITPVKRAGTQTPAGKDSKGKAISLVQADPADKTAPVTLRVDGADDTLYAVSVEPADRVSRAWTADNKSFEVNAGGDYTARLTFDNGQINTLIIKNVVAASQPDPTPDPGQEEPGSISPVVTEDFLYAPEGWKLVTIGDDLSQDKVYTYAGRPMYWTGGSSYAGGEGAVFVTLVKNYDPAKIKVQKAARPGLIYGDVNGNGRIDIADVHTICLLSADPHCFDAAGTAVFSVKGRLSAGLLGLQKPTTDDANQVLSIFNSL